SLRLRRAGFVPAVVYGANQPPQNVQIVHNTVLLASQKEWFFSSILDLNVEGQVQKVLVRDWQKHPFKQLMMHMDFLRINENEALRVSVPLHFLNKEISPAAKTAGVVISHNLTEVEISCLPKDLPENSDVAMVSANLMREEVDEAPAEAAAPAAGAAGAAGAAPGAAGAAAPAAGKKDEKPAAAKKDDKK